MNFVGFNYISNVDISSWLHKISTFTDIDWNLYDYRQRIYKAQHGDTLTIPLIFDESFQPGLVNKRANYMMFKHELDLLTEMFTKKHGEGLIIRAILTKLIKNARIPIHRDNNKSLAQSRRHHIALVTNENVLFTVDGITKNLKIGEVWEIDNTAEHGVINNSDQDRIHLIVDWEKK